MQRRTGAARRRGRGCWSARRAPARGSRRRARARSRRAAARRRRASPTSASRRNVADGRARRAPSRRDRAASAAGRAAPSRVGSTPSRMFSITRQVRRERQLLVDHRDAGAARVERVARRVTVRRRAPSSPASGWSAPARIAISVLLPAPFWPTSAQTSPAAHGQVDAVERDGRAERLADAAHLEARRRGSATAAISIEVGLEQLLHVRAVHVLARDELHAGVDPPLDRLALDVRDHRLDARGSPC